MTKGGAILTKVGTNEKEWGYYPNFSNVGTLLMVNNWDFARSVPKRRANADTSI
jgi:hypothetical protein